MYHGKRIDFMITRRCMNRCIFCSEAFKMDNSEVPLVKAKAVLKKERENGAEVVHLVGGEPTIHKKFLEIAAYAKKLGFTVFIITNGIKFADEEFAKRAASVIDEIMVSVHGHTNGVHSKNTGNDKAYENMIKGLGNLQKHFKGRLEATTAITRHNAKHLLSIAKLIDSFGIREYQCMTIVPAGNGGVHFLDVSPKLLDLQKEIDAVVAFCNQKGVRVRFSGIPLCILGEHYLLSHDLWETIQIDEQEGGIELWQEPGREKNFLIDMGRMKTDRCNSCSYKGICGGIYKEYYKHFGDKELNPIQ